MTKSNSFFFFIFQILCKIGTLITKLLPFPSNQKQHPLSSTIFHHPTHLHSRVHIKQMKESIKTCTHIKWKKKHLFNFFVLFRITFVVLVFSLTFKTNMPSLVFRPLIPWMLAEPSFNYWWPLNLHQTHLHAVATSGNFFRVFLNKHKLHNLIKRKFYILTTTTIKKYTNT